MTNIYEAGFGGIDSKGLVHGTINGKGLNPIDELPEETKELIKNNEGIEKYNLALEYAKSVKI